MALLGIPNVSEGRYRHRIAALVEAVGSSGADVLDIHSDSVHNRSVFTVTADEDGLIESGVALAIAAKVIDLREHAGRHPRVGAVDVWPVVPHDDAMSDATKCALALGAAIADRAGLPVYFYGAAALRPATVMLPDIRRGGLDALTARALGDLPPDAGPRTIDPRWGAVCVGARDPLIAFNVWLTCDGATARSIAAAVRASSGGLPGVRALGLEFADRLAQVSMNLTQPGLAGIDDAFAAVEKLATDRGIAVAGTEIVGLPPERYMPDPKKKAARLLRVPGRSLESTLRS